MIIIYIILGIIVLLVLIGLVTKPKFTLERSIVINRPLPVVFDYPKHIRNQDHFNPWSRMDPDMKKTSTGTDGTVGFIAGWESEMKRGPGSGEQEITAIEENKRVDVELRFLKPFTSTSPAWFITKPVGDGKTEVTWGLYTEMKFPMSIMSMFINFKKVMGKQFDEGLGVLKGELEK